MRRPLWAGGLHPSPVLARGYGATLSESSMSIKEQIEELRHRRNKLYAMGGEARIKKQHDSGRLTARERLALFYDPDSFQELYGFIRHRCVDFGMAEKELPGEGVVTGLGLVNQRSVYAASQDFTVAGGAVGAATAQKITRLMDDALRTGHPFVFINDSGGARIQESVDALNGYGDIFYRNIELSGVVPQISIIAGPCAGGAAYSPALTDFIIQVRNEGQMYITGPKVIQQVTGEDVTAEALGGVDSHAHYSGVIHFVAENGPHAIEITKRLLSFLPSNNMEDPPAFPTEGTLLTNDPGFEGIIPDNPREPYDMKQVIHRLLDHGDFMEVQALFAPNLIIGFGRMMGQTVAIVANQPQTRAGVLDIDASSKGSRFIRFCNAFNIPIITLVDVPGFLPGLQQEYGGIIRHGAKMLFAYGAATVPKITLIVRKAYGGAYLAMCGKAMGADRAYAWPGAEIAVMGPEGAVNILYRHELAKSDEPNALRKQKEAAYRETFMSPYVAAARGMLDDVIEPAETRSVIAQALSILRSKRELRPAKKHGLIPL